MKAGVVLAILAACTFAGVLFLTSGTGNRHLLITEAVAKPLESGGAVAVLKIENRGAPDWLLSVSSAAAEIELYQPMTTDGIPIQSGKSALALDGAHIRIATQDEEFPDGSLIPLTLRFARAGEVSLRARLSDPAKTGGASEVGLFGLGDICRVGEGEPAPKITLEVYPDGSGWMINVISEEFEFSKELMGLYHVPGLGHGHLYVGGVKLGRMMKPQARIGALPKGRHEVRVTLNTNDHRAYVVDDEPVSARAEIIVD